MIYGLRLRVGRDGHSQPGLTRLRPGGGRIETASRRHRPPPVIHLSLIPNRSIPFCLDKFPNLSSQILPNPFHNLPKPIQNPPKIETKSIQKASWVPSWTHARKKLAFERPKSHPKTAKSVQEMPQSVPNPSQMEPKTFQNLILKRFFSL